MKRMKMEEILYLEDVYALRTMSHTCVTVHINRWHYYVPRVRLTMIEGSYKTEEEIEKALREAEYGKKSLSLPEDYPKHFTLACRPRDLLNLAKTLVKICQPEEQPL